MMKRKITSILALTAVAGTMTAASAFAAEAGDTGLQSLAEKALSAVCNEADAFIPGDGDAQHALIGPESGSAAAGDITVTVDGTEINTAGGGSAFTTEIGGEPVTITIVDGKQSASDK